MRWRVVALGLFVSACREGAAHDPGDTDFGESGGPDTSSDGSESDGSESPTVTVKPRPLQHLTRAQYEATVSDLWPGAPTGLGGDVETVDPRTGALRTLGALDPDDTQQGFEMGTAMSSFLPERYFDRAEFIATELVTDLDTVLPCAASSPGDACAETFVSTFGLRAFRRPPTTGETNDLLAFHNEIAGTEGFEAGIEAMAFAMLSSPSFLYHLEAAPGGQLTDYELASRLSYFVTGSMPDTELFEAAADGRLSSEDGFAEQAERLLASPRAVGGLYGFLRQWLVLDHIESLQKDIDAQPDFDPILGPDLRASLEQQLRALVETPETTVADLLLDEGFYVNERLADFYGVPRDGGDPEAFVSVSSPERVGVLAHPGVLASNSKLEETQLVARGLFVSDRLLCLAIPVPPDDVPLEIPDVDPDDPPANMRERFEQHVESPSCANCHAFIDPPGFAMENYDGLGRYRTQDVYGMVDASGELSGFGDADGPFSDFDEFNRLLAHSDAVAGCIAERMFEVAVGRPVSADDADDALELGFIRDQAAAADGNLRGIAREIVTTASFREVPE